MAGVKVRLADASDGAELAAIGELTVAAYAADALIAADDPYAEHLRAAGERAAEAELAVAVDDGSDGRVLGTVTFAAAGTPWAEVSLPGEAEFRMLAVAPSARGRGVGGALTDWCVRRAQDLGCTAVVLSTQPMMHAAHRIYQRRGFERLPDRDWSPYPGVDLIAYRLPL